MLYKTGDHETSYGIAQGRDENGALAGVMLGMTLDEATEAYDNFKAVAVLQVDLTVLSSIDGIIEEKETDENG